MRSYEAVTRIDASPEEVWRHLVDVASWRDWDSGLDRVEGRVALGERLTIYATMIRSRPFTVTVTELRPREAMRWRRHQGPRRGELRARLGLSTRWDRPAAANTVTATTPRCRRGCRMGTREHRHEHRSRPCRRRRVAR
jgi:uncharacterized protein YndB with AHSA1/START domain